MTREELANDGDDEAVELGIDGLAGAMKPSLASSGKGDVERRLEELAAKPKGTKP